MEPRLTTKTNSLNMEYTGKKVSDAVEAEMMSRYKYEEYVALDMREMKEKLERLGVCVVPNVLSEQECLSTRRGMWQWLEEKTSGLPIPLKRRDPRTWSSFFSLSPMHSMLLQHWGVGHAQFAWDVRTNARVLEVFASLWNVCPSDLVCSFDGVSMHFPPEVTGRGFYRGNTWLHTDQSYERAGFECVQSWVTAREVRVGDATLAFIPRSHLLHAAFAKQFDCHVDRKDWCKLSVEQQQWYMQQTGSAVEFIRCPRGSMVLWDSRTIHSGSESLRTRPLPNMRQVVYVCMTPRRLCNSKALASRIKAFEAGRMTTHWPHRMRVFPKMPQLYGKSTFLPLGSGLVVPPPLGPAGRRLVGYS